MKTTLKIDGLQDFDNAIAEFSKATARNVLLRAGKSAAEPMAERMRELVHRRSGKTAASIDVVAIPTTGSAVGKAAYASAIQGGATTAEAGEAAHAAQSELPSTLNVLLSIGPTGKRSVGLAHLEEFGSIDSAPHPFIRPAFDETVDGVVGSLRTALGAEIDKAAARAARRAAKKAGG